MFENVGPLERKLRIIIGLALIAIGFAAPLPEQGHLASMSIGIIALFPATFGFCPLKALLFRRLGKPS
jgi:hypothetical protein